MLLLILLPLFAGVLTLVVPSRMKYIKELIALATVLVFLTGAGVQFFGPEATALNGLLFRDALSAFILIFIGFFGLITLIYSLGRYSEVPRGNEYYSYILWTLGAGAGAVLSLNMILFLSFWGFLGITLYMLIGLRGPRSAQAAKKTMLVVGGADAFLILGWALLFYITGSYSMNTQVAVAGRPATFAFLFFTFGAFSKAGAFPFHTWVPDAGSESPAGVAAFLPASLDKLLGIYFLFRICTMVFEIPVRSWMAYYLMSIGAITLIAAVMMALVQHHLRRLLAYHAVSQVGYMVMGIATMNPLGLAGALFHMLNNALYKSCLFFCAGNVEQQTKSERLAMMGGLAAAMPLTFIAMGVSALAISGVPPLNGFASKWFIYSGLVQAGQGGDFLWPLWLLAAMFGSALTLASFIKVLHSVFLGTPKSGTPETEEAKEAGGFQTASVLVLALICVLFGVFYAYPVEYLLEPVVEPVAGVSISGQQLGTLWHSGPATALILFGLFLGLAFYWLWGLLKKARIVPTFVGGAPLDPRESSFSGTEFYRTISELPGIAELYSQQEKGMFDIYELFSKLSISVASYFSRLHTGVLNTYVLWILIGLVLYLFIFVGTW